MGRIAVQVGIEKMRVYPTALTLNLAQLASERGYDVNHMHQQLMVYERSLNPTWEDPVTMAVNAAKGLLTETDKASIGLLIVCTETGLDLEKSLSSWVHHYLDLPSHCRHFELKCACYSGTAALKMACAWLLSNALAQARGQKALVITTDQSLISIGKPWEYVNGAGSVAMLISNNPCLLELDMANYGVYAHEVSDVIRPLPWVETGNSDDSLFSYMEGLSGAYENFVANSGINIDFNTYFDYNIYHVPFSGISLRAHKQLLKFNTAFTKDQVVRSFEQKTLPSLTYPQRIGGIYGGAVYLALLSLICNAQEIKAGDRVGIFSYGSGSCAEFYTAIIGDEAKVVAQAAGLDALLDARHEVSVSAYEAFERARVEMQQNEDFTPNKETIPGLYASHYSNKGLLIYTGSKGYYRHYEFS